MAGSEEHYPPRFESDDHALHAGVFMGWVLNQRGVTCYPVPDDEGVYTNEFIIDTAEGIHFHVSIKPPNFGHEHGE